jgi:hypothetical protein
MRLFFISGRCRRYLLPILISHERQAWRSLLSSSMIESPALLSNNDLRSSLLVGKYT